MKRFVVEWVVRSHVWAEVDAESESEAIAKAKAGEIVRNTEDSDPGRRDLRTFKISSQPVMTRKR